MTDCIALKKGHDPWQPSESAELIEVFHRFTIPLVGLISQEGVPFVFWCIVGSVSQDNAWGYARLNDAADAQTLREADADHFADALRDLVDGNASQFAVASDDTGLTDSVIIDPPTGFEDIMARGMDLLQEKMTLVEEEMESLRAQFSALRRAGSLGIVPTHDREGVPA